MKRFVLLLAASATLLVPAAPAFAASAHPNAWAGEMSTPAPIAHVDGVSKIPPQLCFAFFGSDLENVLCSSR